MLTKKDFELIAATLRGLSSNLTSLEQIMKRENSNAANAIGHGDGASIVLQTARARVEVVNHENKYGEPRWHVRGDVPLIWPNMPHETAASAVRFAFECLAEYNK